MRFVHPGSVSRRSMIEQSIITCPRDNLQIEPLLRR
jgi:hypothetical protein